MENSVGRKPLIAGNWKMNGTEAQAASLLTEIQQGAHVYAGLVDVAVLPAFVHLFLAKTLLQHSPVKHGAQNLYLGAQGAFTGEVSGPMLKGLDCSYVIVGHSERRAIFGEDLALIADKCKAAMDAGLTPILCVGETRAERERGETESVVREQLVSVIRSQGPRLFERMVIAYEPVWAIGTGLTAAPEEAQEVHAFIRRLLLQNKVDMAESIRILYGGSMKADNAASLLAMPDIDGGLVGGASLEAKSFLAICAAASKQ
jgi:triosephosphate isomerase